MSSHLGFGSVLTQVLGGVATAALNLQAAKAGLVQPAALVQQTPPIIQQPPNLSGFAGLGAGTQFPGQTVLQPTGVGGGTVVPAPSRGLGGIPQASQDDFINVLQATQLAITNASDREIDDQLRRIPKKLAKAMAMDLLAGGVLFTWITRSLPWSTQREVLALGRVGGRLMALANRKTRRRLIPKTVTRWVRRQVAEQRMMQKMGFKFGGAGPSRRRRKSSAPAGHKATLSHRK